MFEDAQGSSQVFMFCICQHIFSTSTTCGWLHPHEFLASSLEQAYFSLVHWEGLSMQACKWELVNTDYIVTKNANNNVS